MNHLHVMDVYSKTKSVPKIADHIASVTGGQVTYATDHPIDTPEYPVIDIGAAIRLQSRFDVIHIHSARHATSFLRSRNRLIRHFYGSPKEPWNRYWIMCRISDRLMAKKYKLVVALSQSDATAFSRRYGREAVAIYPGVSNVVDGISEPDSFNPNLLFVGNLKPRKRVHLLIRALVHSNNSTLTIVGTGSEELSLRQLAVTLGVSSRVRFLGKTSEEELAMAYRMCDLHVTASEYEGFGMPILEAMAMGKPSVATYCDAHLELSSASGAVLISQDTPTDFSDAIKTALCEHGKLSGNALKFAKQHSWSSYYNSMMENYRMNSFLTLVSDLKNFKLQQTPVIEKQIEHHLMLYLIENTQAGIIEQKPLESGRSDIIVIGPDKSKFCIEIKLVADASCFEQLDRYSKDVDGLILICWKATRKVRKIFDQAKLVAKIPIELIEIRPNCNMV